MHEEAITGLQSNGSLVVWREKMTANADTQTDMTTPAPERGFLATACERPVLFAASALLFFVPALFGSTFFGSPERIKAVVDVVRLDLDQDASSPVSLIRATPLAIDIERTAILSDQFIGEALDKMVLGADATLPLPSRSSSTTGGRNVGATTLTKTVFQDLRVKAAVETNALELSLSPDVIGPAGHAAEIVNKIATSYVDLRNQERKQQKEEALGWADKKLAYWQGAIEILKPAHVASPSDTVTLAAASPTDSRKLLNFLMDATRSAQADTLSKIRNTVNVTDDQRREHSLNALEYHYTELLQDLERLESISFEVDRASDGQQSKPSNLRDAEEKLTLFKKDLEALISSGLLDSPAAKITSLASAVTTRSLSQWAVIIPLAAALSILLAMALVSIMARWQPTHARKAATAGLKAGGDVLSDPHWPMTPQQRREELIDHLDRQD